MSTEVAASKNGKNKILRDEKGRILPGQKLNPKGLAVGYKKDAFRVKHDIVRSFKEMGGINGFVEWGRKEENRKAFYEIVVKCLPKQLDIESESINNFAEAMKRIHEHPARSNSFSEFIEMEKVA